MCRGSHFAEIEARNILLMSQLCGSNSRKLAKRQKFVEDVDVLFFVTKVEMQSGKGLKREKRPSAATLRCEGAPAGTHRKGIERA